MHLPRCKSRDVTATMPDDDFNQLKNGFIAVFIVAEPQVSQFDLRSMTGHDDATIEAIVERMNRTARGAFIERRYDSNRCTNMYHLTPVGLAYVSWLMGVCTGRDNILARIDAIPLTALTA